MLIGLLAKEWTEEVNTTRCPPLAGTDHRAHAAPFVTMPTLPKRWAICGVTGTVRGAPLPLLSVPAARTRMGAGRALDSGVRLVEHSQGARGFHRGRAGSGGQPLVPQVRSLRRKEQPVRRVSPRAWRLGSEHDHADAVRVTAQL